MKPSILVTLGLTCSTFFAAPVQKPVATPPTEDLIEQLRSESYKEREEASQKLWELGESGLDHLKAIVDSNDPEQVKRAEILIRNIEAGVLPSTDKNVISAIDRYRSTDSVSEKLAALEQLIELKALKQVLYLLRWEENDRERESLALSRKVRGVALLAAHQALKENDTEEALRLLRIAPESEENARALAYSLKYSGLIDAEIDAIKKSPAELINHEWLLTLLRVKGDLVNARKVASRIKNDQALVTLSVLEGNPSPLLDTCKSRSSLPNHTIALNLLKRQHLQHNPKELHEVISELADALDNEAADADEVSNLEYVTRIALLMGDREVGERLLKQYNEAYAIAYFSSQEYSHEEFALLGTPNPITQPEEFNQWITDEIKRELDADLGILSEQESRIEQIARFYYSRGEKERSLQILTPLLKALEEDGDDRWFEIVGEFPLHGMSDFILHFASQRVDGDETYLQLSYTLFGNVEEMDFIWATFSKLSPKQTKLEHFQQVLEVMGVHDNTTKQEDSVLAQFTAHFHEAKGEERAESIEALAYAAETRNDFKSMLQHYKELCAMERNAENLKFRLKYQRAAEVLFHWEEIVASYDLFPESYMNNSTRLARYAIAKRRLGDTKTADALLKRAKLLSLGTTKNLNELATVLHECGARSEAKEIWLDHIACLDAGTWDFYYVLNYINHQSRFAIAERNWKLAASFSLAEMAFLVEPTLRPSSYYSSLRSGYTSTYTTGMSLLAEGEKSKALRMLKFAHDTLPGDGTLADDFFPSIMRTSLKSQAKDWFEVSWSLIEKEIDAYPNDHNARNTAAWLGSRAGLKLDASLKHAKSALRTQPEQPAYLDTLAEVYFAKRDRASAIKHSDLSLEFIKTGAYAYISNPDRSASMLSELSQQNARFKNEAFPRR